MSAVTLPASCEKSCACHDPHGETQLIVLTGGPGAGKTAVLEIIRKQLCRHVVILPEAASIIFGGGFWRLQSVTAVKAAQRAIMDVQREMERLVLEEKAWALGLCDRGLLDGLAYWPGDGHDFWDAAGVTPETAYARYRAVIHLRVPGEDSGYNHANPLRIETAVQARAIDDKIAAIWSKHPHYRVIESRHDFLAKAQAALDVILEESPDCCKS